MTMVIATPTTPRTTETSSWFYRFLWASQADAGKLRNGRLQPISLGRDPSESFGNICEQRRMRSFPCPVPKIGTPGPPPAV